MYQVLARKYRPRNFYELVGQQHVSKALTSALERSRLHHAYLFTGTRGVGKTTIARILAKCLNCETGITAIPCEKCNVCQAVNEGRFIDLIEIDAASRTKVEDTRELLDNVPYAPTQGRFKVYLIDEVHMLSTHSFNALLKTLEEPPEHVKFLFATTDPQKLPITVISRCLQFTLRPLTIDEIQKHLDYILGLESISHDTQSLWQLAESAQGSLRDALSLTDQAIAYGQGKIHQQDVKEMLGLIDKHLVYDLLTAIHQNQRQWVAELLLTFRQQAIDVSVVLDQLISTLHELALMQYLPRLALNYSDEINQKIQTLAQTISAQDLQLYYQLACKGRDELQLAVTQEQGFEMCVLRLLAFRPLAVNEIVQPAMISTQQTPQLETHSDVDISKINSVQINQSDLKLLPTEQLIIFQDDDLIHLFENSNDQMIELEKTQGVMVFDCSQDILDVVDQTDLSILNPNSCSQDADDTLQSFATIPVGLSPQQILQIPQQEIKGRWTAKKWEYWLKTSELSPVTQGLLQNALMTGDIIGTSILHIDIQYQSILQDFIPSLEQALKQIDSQNTLTIQWQLDAQAMTPIRLYQQREALAYQQAMHWLHQHSGIAYFIQAFSGQIREVSIGEK